MWHVLAVEDDVDVQHLIRRSLGAGIELSCAKNSAETRQALELRQPDLILLDVSLPDGPGGYEICSTLQSDEFTRDIPIIFLTSRGSVQDKVTAFRLGADDHVEKPFAPEELRARVEARIEKRRRRQQEEQVLCKGDLRIDIAGHRVSKVEGNTEIWLDLTPYEIRLLYQLARSEDRILSREQLMDAVWTDVIVAPRTIDSHVSKLRKKLGTSGEQIQSVRGIGYCFKSRRLKISPHDAEQLKTPAIEDDSTSCGASGPSQGSNLIAMNEQVVVDPELWELIPGYLERRHSDVEALHRAIEMSDFDCVRVLGHKMRGSGTSYGFERISEIGRSLEEAADKQDVETIRTRTEELAVHIDAVEPVRG